MSEALQGALAALRAQGAEGFDGPGLRFIEGLLVRAAALGGAAQAHLEGRAQERLGALEARFAQARAAAAERVAALEAAGADGEGRFAAWWAAGAFAEIERHAPAALRQVRAADPAVEQARLLRLVAEARRRGVPAGEAAAVAQAPAEVRALGDALARRLFRAAADQARSAVIVARAADRVVPHHGPYNPEALVAEALARLEVLAPRYLEARLAGLEDLAALAALSTQPAAPPRRRRGR